MKKFAFVIHIFLSLKRYINHDRVFLSENSLQEAASANTHTLYLTLFHLEM